MTIAISDTDPRSIKAVEIAAGAGHWLKCRLADGTKAYAVPSQQTDAQFPLRHGQLAALVWRDCDRTHNVRSGLYRLRAKLRGSGWAIPFPPNGEGVRLVRVQSPALAAA